MSSTDVLSCDPLRPKRGQMMADLTVKLPSVDNFFKIVLSWDFYRDIRDDTHSPTQEEFVLIQRSLKHVVYQEGFCGEAQQGHESEEGVSATMNSRPVEPLPLTFDSEEDYKRRFLPLFLLEAKQMIHRAKEVELCQEETVVQAHAEEKEGFLKLTVQRQGHSTMIMQRHDLCLLSVLQPSTKSSPKPLDKATNERETQTSQVPDHDTRLHILAIVDNAIRNQVCLKLYFPKVDIEDVESIQRFQSIAQLIGVYGQNWNFRRIMGLSTLIREYQALFSLDTLHLKDDLLFNTKKDSVAGLIRELKLLKQTKANLHTLSVAQQKKRLPGLLEKEKILTQRLQYHRILERKRNNERLEIPKQLDKKINQLYNASQLQAIQECHKVSGITLIQGPPGTGKTTTIVGILSVLLNSTVKTSSPNVLTSGSITKRVDEGCSESTTEEDLDVSQDPFTPEVKENEMFLSASSNNLNSHHLARVAQPWIYQPEYIPWYDTASLVLEDLETFKEVKAWETDAMVQLAESYHSIQPRRILVCAPSNAAIDEILKRLTGDPQRGGGILNALGDRYSPTVIRLGPNIHPDLMRFSLEDRTNSRLQALGQSTHTKRNAVKTSVLSEASIVCCTLSISGSRELTTLGVAFDTVVIDEASQGVELATLIPLKYSCRRLILVGDPKQLPATVFSRVAIENHYDQSLFQRLERAGHKVNMLSLQYRMHPTLSVFPSKTFYGGQLCDAPGLEDIIKPPFPWYTLPIFSPMVFFSLNSTEQSSESSSWFNMDEALFVVEVLSLLSLLFQHLPGYESCWQDKVAVISPYSEQIRVIRKLINARFQTSTYKPLTLDVQTVDGFQGREKDFIIFSAVRANYMNPVEEEKSNRKANVGFLADLRRMNVALTRARCNLWIIGNGHYLKQNPEWAKLWNHSELQNCQFHVNQQEFPLRGYLKRWLADYLERVPSARVLLETHVPTLPNALKHDLLEMDNHVSVGFDQLIQEIVSDSQLYVPGNHIIQDEDIPEQPLVA